MASGREYEATDLGVGLSEGGSCSLAFFAAVFVGVLDLLLEFEDLIQQRMVDKRQAFLPPLLHDLPGEDEDEDEDEDEEVDKEEGGHEG